MDDKKYSLTGHFEGIKNHRIDRRKLHNLTDIILITLCAMIAGCDTCDEFEVFGNSHTDWLKTFLKLPNGTPSHDTFERVFARIDPKQFKQCFASWSKSLAGLISGVIAIDGQTHRGARQSGQIKTSVHMVSALAAGLRLVLANCFKWSLFVEASID